jgi:hypothetical protein
MELCLLWVMAFSHYWWQRFDVSDWASVLGLKMFESPYGCHSHTSCMARIRWHVVWGTLTARYKSKWSCVCAYLIKHYAMKKYGGMDVGR